MPTDNNFAQFIENLRISRNISREDFVYDIISLRQYQRFINGESSIKTNNMIQLLKKVEITSFSAFLEVMKRTDFDLEIIYRAYSQYVNQDYKTALDTLGKIKYEKIDTITNQKLYDFIKIACDFKLNIISETYTISNLISLIDYPNILNNEILTFVEINVLLFINDYLVREKKDYRIPNFMFELLQNKKRYPDKINYEYLSIFYSQVSKYLGAIGEIKKSLSIANEGIEFCQKYQVLYGLNSLLFVKALGEKKLYEDKRYIETVRRLFGVINIFNETNLTQTYTKLIKKHLGLTKADFYK